MENQEKVVRVNMVSESDISIQGHGVHTAYIEMASSLEKRADVRVIRGDFGRNTDCDVVHIHTIGSHTFRKLYQRGVKKVVSVHVVPASFLGSIRMAKYWLPFMKIYLRWFYSQADKNLAVSESVAKALREELKIPAHKIEVFYNTIEMDRYKGSAKIKAEQRKKLGIEPNDFVVLGNGQVQPRKRLDTFIAMAKALPEVKFIWIGGIPFKQLGAEYGKMTKLMNRVPKNMIITGIIDHQKVRGYLNAADVFCLPAEQENHPMSVLEAAGAGLPIVLRDIVEYNDTFKGDAIMAKKNQEFVSAIKQLHEDPEFYKAQLEKTKNIAKRFDSANAAERLVKLYRELINK